MADLIQTKNLSKKYAAVIAVDAVSISIKKGELFGLLGPNGAGKSTLIKILTGQVKPDTGTAEVAGNSILEPVKIRQMVGIIPEQENPPSFLTGEEYLEYVARIRKLDNISARCKKWIDFLEIENSTMLCKDLSRGTRQKLMIAQAFLHDPSLAFIDEPLTNLDPVNQKRIKDFLREYVRKGGTVFFSTHTLEIAQEICTRIAIIQHGKIILDKPIKNIKNLEKLFLRTVT